ncbi:MAG: hypothetical protein WAN59_15095 [Candidatus Baltobacteraceae bacterium]|jgi:hypothetical protein
MIGAGLVMYACSRMLIVALGSFVVLLAAWAFAPSPAPPPSPGAR